MIRRKTIFSSLTFVCGLMLSSLFVSCDSLGGQKDENKVDYLAVQIDENDSWSIIDAEGKVIVDREYDKDDKVSIIYDGGIYWVCSKDKYRLYSIDSPKKSLTDKEYDKVTEFREGRAFVSINGQPIIMIDEKGNHLKTLSKDVAMVTSIRDGMVPFQNQEGLWGFLNKNGDVVIPAAYKDVHNFDCGVSCVYSGDDGKTVSLIDKKGNTIKTWNKEKYTPSFIASEDKWGMTVDGSSDNPSVVYLDLKGNEVFGKVKGYKRTDVFYSGYAVIYNNIDDDYAVINDKGEKVIRGGKYKSIMNMGNGIFIAKKGDKCGIVDAEDNTLVKFDYDGYFYYRLGDNYIMKSGNYYVLVTPKGEEVKKAEFRNYSALHFSVVEYIDLQSGAEMFTRNVSTKGLVLSNGRDDVASIAKALDTKLDSCGNYEDTFINTLTQGKWKVSTEMKFNRYIKNEKFHEEKVNDGWFETTNYVSDGYQWNPDAKLAYVKITMELPAQYHKSFQPLVEKSLKSKGFKKNKDNGYFYCGSGDKEKRIKFNSTEYDNQVELIFITDSEYFFYL